MRFSCVPGAPVELGCRFAASEDESRFALDEIEALQSWLGARLDEFQRDVDTANVVPAPLRKQLTAQIRFFSAELGELRERIAESGDASARTGELRSTLRMLALQIGGMVISLDWQSPSIACSVASNSGLRAAEVANRRYDYCRDRHLDAEAVESRLLSKLARSEGCKARVALATNSGMAALQTILNFVLRGDRDGAPLFVGKHCYHETPVLLRHAAATRLRVVDDTDIDALLRRIETERPAAIFLDTVSNSRELRVIDALEIARRIDAQAAHPICIVIDTTGAPLSWRRHLAGPASASPVTLFFWESLAKFYQHGLDLVTGGYLVAEGEPSAMAALWKLRAWCGTNITQFGSAALPPLDEDMFRRRIERTSRNTRRLAQELADTLAASGLDHRLRVVSPYLPGHPEFGNPEYRGAFINLELAPVSGRIEDARMFIDLVLARAAENGVQLIEGTSFGFNETRISLIAAGQGNERAFLRVAPGTEALRTITAIARLIAGCVEAPRSGSEPPASAESVPVLPGADAPGRRTTLNVFSGEDSIERFLNPGENAFVPLVELPRPLNPLRDRGVRIYAKLMYLVPLLNVKSFPAFNMLRRARECGEISSEAGMLESSSLNTALSLAVTSRVLAEAPCRALIDRTTPANVVDMLRLFGVDVMLHDASPGQPTRVRRAVTLAQERGWFHAGQYSNPANPESHELWTGAQIWEQLAGKVDLFCSNLGTAGTIIGTSQALRDRDSSVRVLGTLTRPGEFIPGPRGLDRLGDVDLPWRGVADATLEVPIAAAYRASVGLLRHGILAGPSSGMNLSGLLTYLEDNAEPLKTERKTSELNAVFICCDTPFLHLDRYKPFIPESMLGTLSDAPPQKLAPDS